MADDDGIEEEQLAVTTFTSIPHAKGPKEQAKVFRNYFQIRKKKNKKPRTGSYSQIQAWSTEISLVVGGFGIFRGEKTNLSLSTSHLVSM